MREFLNSRVRLYSSSNEVVDGWIHEANAHQVIVRLEPGCPQYTGTKFELEAHGSEHTVRAIVRCSYHSGLLMTVLPLGPWQKQPVQQDQRRRVQGLFAQWTQLGVEVHTPVIDASQHGFGALMPEALLPGIQTEVVISCNGTEFVATVEVLYSESYKQVQFGKKTGFKFVEFKCGSEADWIEAVLQAPPNAA